MLSAFRDHTRPFVFRALAAPGATVSRTSVPAGPIVVGVDMSSASRRAVVDAARIAESTGASLHLVMSVRKPWSLVVAGHGESWNLNWLSVAEQFLDNLVRELPVTCVTRTITTRASDEAVEQAAARLNASMIVVRTHNLFGRSRARVAVGQPQLVAG